MQDGHDRRERVRISVEKLWSLTAARANRLKVFTLHRNIFKILILLLHVSAPQVRHLQRTQSDPAEIAFTLSLL
jgi:hypothetical protein